MNLLHNIKLGINSNYPKCCIIWFSILKQPGNSPINRVLNSPSVGFVLCPGHSLLYRIDSFREKLLFYYCGSCDHVQLQKIDCNFCKKQCIISPTNSCLIPRAVRQKYHPEKYPK